MRKFKILFFVLMMSNLSAQVHWMTLPQALEAQKKHPKKIFIDFYANWCANCKKLETSTFLHSVIAEYLNNNFYAVRFNSEGNDAISFAGQTFTNPEFKQGKQKNTLHQFTQYMNVNAVPTFVFLDENAAPITLLQGALTAKELEPYLPFIAKDEYKKVNTRDKWENYQQKFKSKILN